LQRKQICLNTIRKEEIPMAEEKEPFVASADRPNVNLNPDTPISELHVRDLQALLQSSGHIKTTMEKLAFLEKQIKNEMKLEKLEYPEKYGYPEKHFKNEMKLEKLEYPEKHFKNELKLEKLEHKELKFELPEKSPAPEGQPFAEQQVPGPTGIDQLIQTISKLTEQVGQLSRDVDLLKQQSTGGHS
jgi:hypothetical protein